MILFVFLASTVLGGCVLQERKQCSGFSNRQDIRLFNRQHQDETGSTGKFGDCLKQCEYFGIDGCCQYDVETGKCWFSLDGKLTTNNMERKVMVSEYGEYPVRYGYQAQRKAGMCKWSGHLTMVKYHRKMQCDWNGGDKKGQKQKSGSTDKDTCWEFCFQDAKCLFASFKNGQCRSFQTCSNKMAYVDNGYELYQKVDQEAPTDPVDNRWAGQRCDDDCEKYKKEWIGDGVCDHDACALCPSYTTNGQFDKGDCEAAAFEAEALAYLDASSGGTPTIINLMAAVGFAFTVYGAFRHFTK